MLVFVVFALLFSILSCLVAPLPLSEPSVSASSSTVGKNPALKYMVEICNVAGRDKMAITDVVGGRYGEPFSDCQMVAKDNYRIGQIAMSGCQSGQHVRAVAFGWREKSATDASIVDAITTHGISPDGVWTYLRLDLDDYVTGVAITTWRAKVSMFSHHTRIGRLEFGTKKGNRLACGAYSLKDSTKIWTGTDMALLYLSGRQGKALDALKGHFMPLDLY